MSRILQDALVKPEKGQSVKEWFAEIAGLLLNQNKLVIAGKDYQILEIEFYLNSKQLNHEDPFAHCNERQLTCGEWYFHRKGKNAIDKYSGGNYKGLDITFGDDNNKNEWGGILIRSIKCNVCNKIIDGPSLIVDHIETETNKKKETLEQVAKNNYYSIFDYDNNIHIDSLDNIKKDDRLSTARVGLTLEKAESPKDNYIKKEYRVVVDKEEILKGIKGKSRPYTISALIKNPNISDKNIHKKMGGWISTIENHKKFSDSMPKSNISKFHNNNLSKISDLCEMLGI